MENLMGKPMHSALGVTQGFDQMLPDAYIRIIPHVEYIINGIGNEHLMNMTCADVDHITQEVMRRSNVSNDPPAGHNIHTMGDMTRGMVVRGLQDRHRRFRFSPFFSPFFFFPFEDRDRFFFRDHEREEEEEERERRRDRGRDREEEEERGRRRERGRFR